MLKPRLNAWALDGFALGIQVGWEFGEPYLNLALGRWAVWLSL